eukprot:1154672-Pelagomonas_calceolata.AAC.2
MDLGWMRCLQIVKEEVQEVGDRLWRAEDSSSRSPRSCKAQEDGFGRSEAHATKASRHSRSQTQA